jgi:chorismate mutase / prephenate dehydratase
LIYTLESLRGLIDGVDDKLLGLLNSRMEFVKEVGKLKHANNESIYRPEREKQIVERLTALSTKDGGALGKDAIEAIFLEIFAVSRNLERAENVAFLGSEGSFTHQAAESRFGAISEYLSMNSISGVFRAVENKKAKFGVVPIENNSEGVVAETLDLLGRGELKIVAELSMKIHHCMASRALHSNEITKIYSKDIAYAQCKKFIDEMGLGDVQFIPTASTTKAAELALADTSSAAICSHIAAKINKLPVMFENIEDSGFNETRFVVVSDFKNLPSGNDKSSVLVEIENKPGSLVKFLDSFEQAGINLTKIDSRPARNEGFSYIFYMDFEGHIDDEKVASVVKNQKNIKWLGSYAKGV